MSSTLTKDKSNAVDMAVFYDSDDAATPAKQKSGSKVKVDDFNDIAMVPLQSRPSAYNPELLKGDSKAKAKEMSTAHGDAADSTESGSGGSFCVAACRRV